MSAVLQRNCVDMNEYYTKQKQTTHQHVSDDFSGVLTVTVS